jgi:hypothetical protein
VAAKTVNIPAYYMDLNPGLILLKDLEGLFKSNGSKQQGYSEAMIRVTLSPSSKPALDHWQFALVIVGVMLITSIIAICKSSFLFIKLLILIEIYLHSCFAMSYVAYGSKPFIIHHQYHC